MESSDSMAFPQSNIQIFRSVIMTEKTKYVAAPYCRLSKDDGGLGFTHEQTEFFLARYNNRPDIFVRAVQCVK